MSDFQENGFFWNTNVNQQSQYTIRNSISKLAMNRLRNVKVFLGRGPLTLPVRNLGWGGRWDDPQVF